MYKTLMLLFINQQVNWFPKHVFCALVRFARNPVITKGYDESFISLSKTTIMEGGVT